MRVTAYTYMADYHCPDCTKVARDNGALVVNNYHPHAVKLGSSPDLNRDQHDQHYNLVDREGNLIHPIFDIDEKLQPLHCCDCGEEIT